MTLMVGDGQSESDLDSIRNSCDVIFSFKRSYLLPRCCTSLMHYALRAGNSNMQINSKQKMERSKPRNGTKNSFYKKKYIRIYFSGQQF